MAATEANPMDSAVETKRADSPAASAKPGEVRVTMCTPGDGVCDTPDSATGDIQCCILDPRAARSESVDVAVEVAADKAGTDAAAGSLADEDIVIAGSWKELRQEMAAEAVGTFFIIIFGVGSVCSAVLTGSLNGLWQVAVVWGFGVSIAIYCTAGISGAHLNPAVSLALALFRRNDFPLRKLGWYWLAQIGGGVLGGLVNLWAFGSLIADAEAAKSITRGEAGSEGTAMVFGMYYPNPGFAEIPESSVSMAHAFFVEAWGTAVLMFVILALVEKSNGVLGPHKQMAPFFIGFTVACLISCYAPITQAGWNPARDLGPRIVALMAGWGSVAFPGPRGGAWLYTAGPLLGAVVGAFVYDHVLRAGHRRRVVKAAESHA